MKTLPGPVNFSRINPSPPKKPAPRRLTRAMFSDTDVCANKKLSRCTSTLCPVISFEDLNPSRIASREPHFAILESTEVRHEERLPHQLALHRAPDFLTDR